MMIIHKYMTGNVKYFAKHLSPSIRETTQLNPEKEQETKLMNYIYFK